MILYNQLSRSATLEGLLVPRGSGVLSPAMATVLVHGVAAWATQPWESARPGAAQHRSRPGTPPGGTPARAPAA